MNMDVNINGEIRFSVTYQYISSDNNECGLFQRLYSIYSLFVITKSSMYTYTADTIRL